jgi:hypothetical protein
MSFLLKDPTAILDYEVDWGADYLDNDTLSASVWSVAPSEAGGVSIAASAFDATTASVTAAGGVSGRTYSLTNHVVTASGREDERSIVLRVEQR